jgi:hypothetical protein
MKTIAVSLLLGAAALGLAPAAAVQAQTHHKDAAEDAARPAKYYVDVKGNMAQMTAALEATLTFDKPVQIPKAILPAGVPLHVDHAVHVSRDERGRHARLLGVQHDGRVAPERRHESVMMHAQLRFRTPAPASRRC